MQQALRIMIRQGASFIAPLGDPDKGDAVPSLEEISNLIETARNNPNAPWITLNTMRTKVLASEITAYGFIDYDPDAAMRSQMQQAGQQQGQPTAQPNPQANTPASIAEVVGADEEPSPVKSEGIESAPAVIG